jgi:hypothetical protein
MLLSCIAICRVDLARHFLNSRHIERLVRILPIGHDAWVTIIGWEMEEPERDDSSQCGTVCLGHRDFIKFSSHVSFPPRFSVVSSVPSCPVIARMTDKSWYVAYIIEHVAFSISGFGTRKQQRPQSLYGIRHRHR